MRGEQGAQQPNLDEAAPTLTVNEVRQLNRKALFFLAGIVLILLAMAFWFMNSLSNRERQPAQAAAPAPVIETPDMPEQRPATPAQPVEVVRNPPPPLPVLPPNEPNSPGPGRQEGPVGPTLMERRMTNGELPPSEGMEGGGVPGRPDGETAVAEISKPKARAKRLNNPDTLLVRGTYIRCVLETRLVTDLAGPASCIVSEPIYSINGRRLLLPVGTKLLGSYGGGGNAEGQARNRVAVIWDRAITPNGLDVTMSSPSMDNLGGVGVPGQYTAHWANRITTAVLVSLISDVFKYAGEKHGPRSSVYLPGAGAVIEQPYQSNTARTVQNLAQQAVQESALRRPTITVNQGSMLNVYVSQDVDFTGALSGR
ncbi:TrbI/VirB10 family protein [Lysobacter pythonis]|uniref:TrbI/VirB10 family protein n=2 Tax=Solilutibacter pythonis TaxID=2483112 RepID=A0A3M2HVY3_9GAMM|nr:TrbI/VirB10 family protein [Lysobacter pythonis]